MTDSSNDDNEPAGAPDAAGDHATDVEPIRLDFRPSRNDYWLGYCESSIRGWQQLAILLIVGLAACVFLFPSADDVIVRSTRPWLSVELLLGAALCLSVLVAIGCYFSYLFVCAGKAVKRLESMGGSAQFWLTDAGLVVSGTEESADVLVPWKSLSEGFEGSFNFVISGREAQLVIPKRFLPKGQRGRIRKLLRAKLPTYNTFFSRHFSPRLYVDPTFWGGPAFSVNFFRENEEP